MILASWVWWKIEMKGKVSDHRQSRWLENPEPLKAVVNLEPPKGGYSNNFI